MYCFQPRAGKKQMNRTGGVERGIERGRSAKGTRETGIKSQFPLYKNVLVG